MFLYQPLTQADLDSLVMLYETYLNGGAKIREHLTRDIASSGYMGVKCTDENGALVGMATSKPGIDFTVSRPELEETLLKLCGDKRIYTGDMTVVLPAYRKQGASHELARRMIGMLRENGVRMYLTELWIHPSGFIPAEKLYATYGRAVYTRDIPLFYEHIWQYGITCPLCGKRCVCGARVTLLDISEEV